jgi:rRNA-processing protein FCF1
MNQVHAFLDTQTFLHYQWIANINWTSLLSVPSVDVMIPTVVLDELEEKKSGNSLKLRERATGALSRLAPMVSPTPTHINPTVSVGFVSDAPKEVFQDARLNVEQGDDRLIAAVLEFRRQHPGANVAIVSGDTGVIARATLKGIRVVRLPDDYRLPFESDPLEAENQRLKSELAKLRDRLPNLRVAFTGGLDRLEVSLPRPIDVSSAGIDALIASLENKYPPYPNPGFAAAADPLRHPPLGEIQRYQKERIAYFTAMRGYYAKQQSGQIQGYRRFTLPLILDNTGTAPAEHVIVDLICPPTVMIHTVLMGTATPPPSAPTWPLSLRQQMMQELPAYGGLASTLLAVPQERIVTRRTTEPVFRREGDSTRVSIEVDRVQHAVPVALPTLYGEFPSEEAVRGFSLSWLIRSASVANPATGELNIIVKRTVAEV